MLFAGLLEEDKYLGEVNLGDLETTSGERLHYWLLAIKTARKAKLPGATGVKTDRKWGNHVRGWAGYYQLLTFL